MAPLVRAHLHGGHEFVSWVLLGMLLATGAQQNVAIFLVSRQGALVHSHTGQGLNRMKKRSCWRCCEDFLEEVQECTKFLNSSWAAKHAGVEVSASYAPWGSHTHTLRHLVAPYCAMFDNAIPPIGRYLESISRDYS